MGNNIITKTLCNKNLVTAKSKIEKIFISDKELIEIYLNKSCYHFGKELNKKNHNEYLDEWEFLMKAFLKSICKQKHFVNYMRKKGFNKVHFEWDFGKKL